MTPCIPGVYVIWPFPYKRIRTSKCLNPPKQTKNHLKNHRKDISVDVFTSIISWISYNSPIFSPMISLWFLQKLMFLSIVPIGKSHQVAMGAQPAAAASTPWRFLWNQNGRDALNDCVMIFELNITSIFHSWHSDLVIYSPSGWDIHH